MSDRLDDIQLTIMLINGKRTMGSTDVTAGSKPLLNKFYKPFLFIIMAIRIGSNVHKKSPNDETFIW